MGARNAADGDTVGGPPMRRVAHVAVAAPVVAAGREEPLGDRDTGHAVAGRRSA